MNIFLPDNHKITQTRKSILTIISIHRTVIAPHTLENEPVLVSLPILQHANRALLVYWDQKHAVYTKSGVTGFVFVQMSLQSDHVCALRSLATNVEEPSMKKLVTSTHANGACGATVTASKGLGIEHEDNVYLH